MMRVLQTKFGEAEGNCFPACVASVLELPLETIPNFIEQEKETGNHWFWLCNQWLEQLNLALVHLEIPYVCCGQVLRPNSGRCIGLCVSLRNHCSNLLVSLPDPYLHAPDQSLQSSCRIPFLSPFNYQRVVTLKRF